MRRRCGGAKRDSGAQAVIVKKDTMRQLGGWITKECAVNDMSDLGPSPSEENPKIHIDTDSFRGFYTPSTSLTGISPFD